MSVASKAALDIMAHEFVHGMALSRSHTDTRIWQSLLGVVEAAENGDYPDQTTVALHARKTSQHIRACL